MIAKYFALPMMPVFVGSWFALAADISPAQGQIAQNHSILLAQSVYENLPPPPGFIPEQTVDFNQFGESSQIYQPVQYQYNQNFQRYSVYVDNRNSQTLQQVRRIEPTAYIRQYNGRSVVQSGVFNSLVNAQQRVLQLQRIGIYGAEIAGFSNAPVMPNNPVNRNSVRNTGGYYAIIPANSQELSSIVFQVRQLTRLYNQVNPRQQPLGPHVAVGPFNKRTEAIRINQLLREGGFGNARVYYAR